MSSCLYPLFYFTTTHPFCSCCFIARVHLFTCISNNFILHIFPFPIIFNLHIGTHAIHLLTFFSLTFKSLQDSIVGKLRSNTEIICDFRASADTSGNTKVIHLCNSLSDVFQPKFDKGSVVSKSLSSFYVCKLDPLVIMKL